MFFSFTSSKQSIIVQLLLYNGTFANSSSFEYVEQSIDNSQSKIFVGNSELFDDADGSAVIETSAVDTYNSTITDVMYESAVEGNDSTATLSMDEKNFMKTAHSETELCITPTERSAIDDVIVSEANKVDCVKDADSKIGQVECEITEKDDKRESKDENDHGDQNLTNNNDGDGDVAKVGSDVVQQENGDAGEETDEVLEYEPVMVTQTLSNDAAVVDVVEPKLQENVSSVDVESNVKNNTDEQRIEIDNHLEKDGDASSIEDEDKDANEKELNDTVIEVSKTESVEQMNLEPDSTMEVEDADQSQLNQVKNDESINDNAKDTTSAAVEKDEELVGPVVKRGRRRKSQAQSAEKTSEPVEQQMTTRSKSKAAALASAVVVNADEKKSDTAANKATVESEMEVESKTATVNRTGVGRPSTSKRGRKPRQKDTTDTTAADKAVVKSTKSKEKKPVTKSVKRKATKSSSS
ncbi:Ubiquitin carboxyl-terminal hydrolase puf [Trichinella spiralis]|uniref:Ubiquitin carboxyl-terminal hydrolase puf n=1 Tax=Trichinella spiralis TaxID=6334 RepID=A0ABR3KEG5_TRISP